MAEGSQKSPVIQTSGGESEQPYDRRSLTYSTTFESKWRGYFIKVMELFTGKLAILRMIRQFERQENPTGQAFWKAALDVMGIELTTPQSQLDNIPKTGPVVIVANHPHGMVDGMIMAELVGRIRTDYKVLTRSLLTGIDEVAASYLIPVPFPHEENSQRKMMEMRATAMAELKAGGVVALFPSGVVACSDTMMGDAVEAEWNVFTAKMIRRSGASVVPVFFPGQNTRAYQIANRISAVLRQGLLLHEIVKASNRAHAPVVGTVVGPEEAQERGEDPRQFMAWLRTRTLKLGE